MPTAKYENLFTTNAQTKLKADALDLIDDWILDKTQMASAHGAGSGESQAMRELLKMDKTPILGLYGNGDFEKLEDNGDLIHFINHVKVDTN